MLSMSGFASKRYDYNDYILSISMKSYNNKYLDISVKGGSLSPFLEKLIRNVIKEKIIRGRVEVVFDIFFKDSKGWDVQLNEILMDDILHKFIPFCKKYKDKYKEPIDFSLDSLLRLPMLFKLEQIEDNFNDVYPQEIKNSLEEVLDALIKSKAEEGNYLLSYIKNCLDKIEESLKILKEKSEEFELALMDKYRKRIEKLLEKWNLSIDENRLIQEVAIMSDKSCISEEISRLSVHCKRFHSLIEETDIDSKGKEGDFLAQEMLRETHTISAKLSNLAAHDQLLIIRRESEKIKQQIQNIE